MLKVRPILHGLTVLITLVALLAPPPAAAQEIPFASPAFQELWLRYDLPVKEGKDPRSWTWGPASFFSGTEPYRESPGGRRLVQYFDKTRMEINDPVKNLVTNGLLVREMVGGRIALGDTLSEPVSLATEAVAGDPAPINPDAPTYATFQRIASLNNDNRAPNRVGQLVDQSIDKQGVITTVSGRPVRYAYHDPNLGHNIADVFWTFMNQRGTIFTNGRFVDDQLVYDPWFLPMGLPITEPYWTMAQVAGRPQPVLVQLFERRALTYTPANPVDFQVEMGNVGQHYYRWRYQSQTPPPVQAPQFTRGPERTALTATTATIEWETDQETTSRLEYDTDRDRDTFRFRAGSNAIFRTTHTVTIESLQPETVYYWRVIGRNRDGLRVESELHSFRTPAGVGQPTVRITAGPSTQVTATTAVVTWTTNVPTTSEISYGTVEDQLGSSTAITDRRTDHSIRLEGLTPNTTYFYRVEGSDEQGRFVNSTVLSFRTAA
jgi:hypothetical protein